jgi:hypothetical protein
MASTSDYYGGVTAGTDYDTGASTYTTVKYERKHCGRCGFSEMVVQMSSMSYSCKMCGLRESPYDNMYQQEMMRQMMRPQMRMYPQPEPASDTTNSKLEPSSKVEDEQRKKKEQKVMSTFNIGDTIHYDDEELTGVIGHMDTDNYFVWQDKRDGSCGGVDPVGYKYSWAVRKTANGITLIKSAGAEENKTSMLQPLEALSNLIQRSFSEDTKTLYRAGYLSKDLNITKKLTDALGEMFVGHIIAGDIKTCTLETFATELITQAKKEIADAEKAEKK